MWQVLSLACHDYFGADIWQLKHSVNHKRSGRASIYSAYAASDAGRSRCTRASETLVTCIATVVKLRIDEEEVMNNLTDPNTGGSYTGSHSQGDLAES